MKNIRALPICLLVMIVQFAPASFTDATLLAQGKDSPVASAPDGLADTLKRMHDHIKTSPELSFSASFSASDRVLGTNLKGTTRFRTRQPNMLRVQFKVGRKVLEVVSDGKTLTLYRPDKQKFANVPVRDSIIGTMYSAAGLMGIPGRLLDFFWTVDYLQAFSRDNRPDPLPDQTIGGRTCQGIRVVRIEDKFDVWLEKGDVPLPCKLVTRRSDGTAESVQTFVFTWDRSPSFGPDTFSFSPPAAAKEASIGELE